MVGWAAAVRRAFSRRGQVHGYRCILRASSVSHSDFPSETERRGSVLCLSLERTRGNEMLVRFGNRRTLAGSRPRRRGQARWNLAARRPGPRAKWLRANEGPRVSVLPHRFATVGSSILAIWPNSTGRAELRLIANSGPAARYCERPPCAPRAERQLLGIRYPIADRPLAAPKQPLGLFC